MVHGDLHHFDRVDHDLLLPSCMDGEYLDGGISLARCPVFLMILILIHNSFSYKKITAYWKTFLLVESV